MLVSPNNTAYHSSSKLWFNKSFKSIAKYSAQSFWWQSWPLLARLPSAAWPGRWWLGQRLSGVCAWLLLLLGCCSQKCCLQFKVQIFSPSPSEYFLCVKFLLTPSDQFRWHGDVTSNSQLLLLDFMIIQYWHSQQFSRGNAETWCRRRFNFAATMTVDDKSFQHFALNNQIKARDWVNQVKEVTGK